MNRLPLIQSRITVLGAIFLTLFAAVFARLFEKSIIFHAQAQELANAQHFTKQELPPKRGSIFLRSKDGPVPAGLTAPKYEVLVVPKNVKDAKEVARTLAEKLDIKDQEKDIFSKINNQKLYVPPIKRRVDEAPAQAIDKLGLAGVLVIPEHVRFYPEQTLAAQALGFVDYDSEGKYGIEAYYNEELKGAAGSIVAEKDNKGRFINVFRSRQARDGSDVYLTIDSNVQYMAEAALKEGIEKYGAESGQLVVVEAKTGAMLALAVAPSFDPNKFNEVKPEDQKLFLDPVISNVYEPGSIMKPMVIAGGLDAGKFTPDTSGDFSNKVTVQGFEIHTAQDKAFGHENVTKILENSDNVAMVFLAGLMGNDVMHQNFKNFGFGGKTGIDLSGETTGKLLDLKQWRDIHRATMAFGQGISVTPLQILRAYDVIANGGK
ncbi:penicillin-binding protein 2, partial [Candidatus Berkelbacteria bacterium]|nr:penicillin-binding protein 2 [Candidatus Berkelbacteria bacterium]